MKTRCPYCHTYRVEDENGKHLENEDEFQDPCLECEGWLEGDDYEEI